MHLEHLGWAVTAPAETLALLERLFGAVVYKSERVEAEGVLTHFLDAGAKIELLESTREDSPFAKGLAKRGPGLHHLAFGVADIDEAYARVQELGLTPLAPPKSGADGKRIFFLHPRDTHGVLIELCGDAPALPNAFFVDTPSGPVATYTFGYSTLPPLLLLHGAAGCTRLETLALARELEKSFHVIAMDLPGHGQSASCTAFTMHTFVEAALAVADACIPQEKPFSVMGYSLGGALALLVARERAGRVDRVAVHATNMEWDEAHVRRMNLRLEADRLERRAPALFAAFEEAHQGRTRTLFGEVARFAATLPELTQTHRISDGVTCPVLVSAGDRDELFPLEKTLALKAALPKASLALLPDVSHTLTPADAKVLAGLVRRWMLAGA